MTIDASSSKPQRVVKLRLRFAAALAACQPEAGNLPAHVGFDGGPTGQLHGRLLLVGSCLYAESQGVRYLVIWPHGTSLRGGTVTNGDRQVARVGADVLLGGGEYQAQDYDFLRSRLSLDVPPECRDGLFWLATELP